MQGFEAQQQVIPVVVLMQNLIKDALILAFPNMKDVEKPQKAPKEFATRRECVSGKLCEAIPSFMDQVQVVSSMYSRETSNHDKKEHIHQNLETIHVVEGGDEEFGNI